MTSWKKFHSALDKTQRSNIWNESWIKRSRIHFVQSSLFWRRSLKYAHHPTMEIFVRISMVKQNKFNVIQWLFSKKIYGWSTEFYYFFCIYNVFIFTTIGCRGSPMEPHLFLDLEHVVSARQLLPLCPGVSFTHYGNGT